MTKAFSSGRVSVVIPVYNSADFVGEAVESCVRLDVVFEVILVEDGSDDSSLAVCTALQNQFSKVKLLCHPAGDNRGAGASRNLGIRHAKGDFVAFLDADDRYYPNRFELSVKRLSQEPELDGVYNDVGTFFGDTIAEAWWIECGNPLITKVRMGIPAEELKTHLLKSGEHFHTNGILTKRSFFEKCGVFDETLRMCQDTDLWHRMSMSGRLEHSGDREPVSERRIHAANRIYGNRGLNHRKWALQMHEHLLVWCKNNGQPQAIRSLLRERLVICRVTVAFLEVPAKAGSHWRLNLISHLAIAARTDFRVIFTQKWRSAFRDSVGITSVVNRVRRIRFP